MDFLTSAECAEKWNVSQRRVATYMQEFAMISKESEPAKDAVQFLTIHASKGKEFDHVILIGMVNDELPSFQSMKKESLLYC